MKAEMSFEVEWPPVARRLQAAFRHKRIPPAMTEDLVQETGLRLFETWDRVDPQRDLWPLALTIALNILRDHLRTEARRNQITIPDELIDHDTERVALARVELAQINEALPMLTSAQRSALLAELGLDIDRSENSSALKMLRMRARRRLRTLIDGASGLVGSIELGMSRLSRVGPTPLGDQLGPYLSVAAGVLCAAGLSGLSTPAEATTTWGPGRAVESQAAQQGERPAFARALVRSYRSFDGEWIVNIESDTTSDDLDIARNDRPVPKRPRVVTKRPQDHQPPSDKPGGVTEPTPSHEGETSVGPGGASIKEKVSAEAAGHNAEAAVNTESGGHAPGGGCGRESPSERCTPSSASRARARARAELDEKGIELSVGGKQT